MVRRTPVHDRRWFRLHCRPRRIWRAEIDIAVLASGSGTNLQALIDDAGVKPYIRLVISDNDRAPALGRAARAGIDTAVVRWEDHGGRSEFSSALADLLEERGAKGVVLAGFMRILAPSFIDRFPDRILNIHPSLLPAFPGAHAVEAALAHGVRVTGVTVHIVDEKVDHGPIIAQQAVEVRPGDTVETLHRRIQSVEHAMYPEIVKAFVSGELVPARREPK
jgi:phosphoribosylglycinamide formyltransferase-1